MRKDRGAILIVDDDIHTICLLRTELEDQGYTVLTAGHEAKAQQVCRTHGAAIRLFLVDICLTPTLQLAKRHRQGPTFNGLLLARKARQWLPNARLVFLSSLPPEEITTLGGLPKGSSLVRKPFRTSALLETVQRALDEAPAPEHSASDESPANLLVDDQEPLRPQRESAGSGLVPFQS